MAHRRFKGSVSALAAVLSLVFVGALGCGSGDDGAGEASTGGDSGSGGSESGGSSGSSGGDSGAANGGSASGGTDSGGTGSGGAGTAGSGGKGGSGGSGGTGVGPALDAIEDACAVDCDAQLALACAPPNQNRLTCEGNCAAQTGQLGDFCLVEYGAWVACRGAGGYECVQDRPYPLATCASEQLAFSECTRNLGCKRACDRAVDGECVAATFDECVDECITEKDAMPGICSAYLDSLLYCEATATGATECSDDWLATPATCASSAMNVAECLVDEDAELCEGWCWAANRLGCGGSDCAGDCQAKLADATCGMAWLDMLDCATFFGDAACDGETLISNGICDSEASAYASCGAATP